MEMTITRCPLFERGTCPHCSQHSEDKQCIRDVLVKEHMIGKELNGCIMTFAPPHNRVQPKVRKHLFQMCAKCCCHWACHLSLTRRRRPPVQENHPPWRCSCEMWQRCHIQTRRGIPKHGKRKDGADRKSCPSRRSTRRRIHTLRAHDLRHDRSDQCDAMP